MTFDWEFTVTRPAELKREMEEIQYCPHRAYGEEPKNTVHPETHLPHERLPKGMGVLIHTDHVHDGTMLFSRAIANALTLFAESFAKLNSETNWTISAVMFLATEPVNHLQIKETAAVFLRQEIKDEPQ